MITTPGSLGTPSTLAPVGGASPVRSVTSEKTLVKPETQNAVSKNPAFEKLAEGSPEPNPNAERGSIYDILA
jgi:hypothetical protein